MPAKKKDSTPDAAKLIDEIKRGSEKVRQLTELTKESMMWEHAWSKTEVDPMFDIRDAMRIAAAPPTPFKTGSIFPPPHLATTTATPTSAPISVKSPDVPPLPRKFKDEERLPTAVPGYAVFVEVTADKSGSTRQVVVQSPSSNGREFGDFRIWTRVKTPKSKVRWSQVASLHAESALNGAFDATQFVQHVVSVWEPVAKMSRPVVVPYTEKDLKAFEENEGLSTVLMTKVQQHFAKHNPPDSEWEHSSTGISAGDTDHHLRQKLANLIVHASARSSALADAFADQLVPPPRSEMKDRRVRPLSVHVVEGDYTRPNGEIYRPRTVCGHKDVDVLRDGRAEGMFALLYGPPGTGKTALVEASFGHVHTLMGTGDTETADLIGSYVPTGGDEFVWQDGPLLAAMDAGQPLFIDEIGLIDPKVLSILYSVMDGRDEITVTQNPKRGTVKANDGFYVVAATNPNAPGVRLSEALLSRFLVQIEVTSDYELAESFGVVRRLVEASKNLDAKRKNGELMWAPQLRELFGFTKIGAKFGEQFALRNLIASAPEMDRPIVADVLSRAFGFQVTPLRLGD